MFRINCLFLFAFLLFATSCKKSGVSHKTLTLQPVDNPNEFNVTILNGQDASSLTSESIDVDAWTSASNPWFLRGILKFDLSTIPSTATIDSANFYLYSDSTPATGNLVDANYGTSNSFTIQEVSADWSPSTINWSNQPAGETDNQVVIPDTDQSFLDLKVDVTAIIASQVKNNANYGFLLKLQNEVTYNSRIFVSSHNTKYPDRYPKLEVFYH